MNPQSKPRGSASGPGGYHRPNHRWVCGRMAEGCPCRPGPGPKGTCPQTENPCVPTRSLRHRRGMAVAWTLLGTLGLVAYLLYSESRSAFISPGPLTSAHQAAMLESGMSCAACHGGPHPDIGSGFRRVTSSNCLECHDLGTHPLAPHSMDPDALAEVEPGAARESAGVMVAAASNLLPDTLDCTACHRGHHPESMDRRILSQQQCQVCHSEAFTGFAHGHPEFTRLENGGGYPYLERTGIIFSHESHAAHFQLEIEEGRPAPTTCADCHQLNTATGEMELGSFSETCATCHQHVRQIMGTAKDPAIEFLSLPGVDLKTLGQSEHPLSTWWPSGRRGPEWNPYLEVLLAGAEVYPAPDYDWPDGTKGDFQQDLERIRNLPRGMRDLRRADADDIAATHRIALATRHLFYQLRDLGPPGVIRSRLERALGRPLTDSEVHALTAQLPRELVNQAAGWFGP